MALEEAGCRPEDIGYINAHGTSTPPGDLVELRTIERLFSSSTAVSSTKSSIGHLLGAAGSVEAIFTILTLKNGTAPYTLNLDDPEDHTVELIRRAPKNIPHVRYALSNSFGFGGTNASLIFEKVDPAL
jgi:3-oxoacyl-[acyl-carrier-protein] synthase II